MEAGQEPSTYVHTVRARRLVPGLTKADDMKTRQSESAMTAVQAGKTGQKLLKTGRQWPAIAITAQKNVVAASVDQSFLNRTVQHP